MSRTRPIIFCARCSRARQHESRGLCSACWQWAYARGMLDNYPRVRNLRRSVDTAAEYAFLSSQGYTRHDVAAQLGITVDGLDKALKRAGRQP